MLRTIITTLNEFAKENTFLSLIILAIIGNIATDVFKKISIFVITSFARQTNKWSQKNIKKLIELYEKDIERVEKIKRKDLDELFDLLETLYNNVILLFFLIIIYLVIIKVNSNGLFYSFLGTGSMTMFKVIGNTIYNYDLIAKSRKFESYEKKMKNRIFYLKKFISE